MATAENGSLTTVKRLDRHPISRKWIEVFSFWSKKPQKQLQNALGQRVWVITSEGRTAPRYFLVGYYTPTKMISESEFRILEGKGKHLQQRVEITELQWFKELFKGKRPPKASLTLTVFSVRRIR